MRQQVRAACPSGGSPAWRKTHRSTQAGREALADRPLDHLGLSVLPACSAVVRRIGNTHLLRLTVGRPSYTLLKRNFKIEQRIRWRKRMGRSVFVDARFGRISKQVQIRAVAGTLAASGKMRLQLRVIPS
jgi:hypothetical protein